MRATRMKRDRLGIWKPRPTSCAGLRGRNAHGHLTRELLCEKLLWKTEGQRAYPDLTPVFDTYCKNPAVWTHCLWNSVPQTPLHICRTTSIISHIVLSQHTSNAHAHAQLCHRELFHTQSATHTDNHVMLFADLSSTVSFTFTALPIPFSHLFRVYWKNLTCGVLRSFNLLALET